MGWEGATLRIPGPAARLEGEVYCGRDKESYNGYGSDDHHVHVPENGLDKFLRQRQLDGLHCPLLARFCIHHKPGVALRAWCGVA